MNIKIVPLLSALVTSVSLVACGVPETQSSRQATAIAGIVLETQTAKALSVPTAASLPADTTPGCPVPTDGTLLLKDEEAGYCLLYPKGLSVVIPYPGQVELFPGAPPFIGSIAASLTVNVEGAEGRTARQAAYSAAVELNCSDGPQDLTIAGEEAVVWSECKGQDLTRRVYIIHADRLYTLTFADLSESFYGQVITSFTFPR